MVFKGIHTIIIQQTIHCFRNIQYLAIPVNTAYHIHRMFIRRLFSHKVNYFYKKNSFSASPNSVNYITCTIFMYAADS